MARSTIRCSTVPDRTRDSSVAGFGCNKGITVAFKTTTAYSGIPRIGEGGMPLPADSSLNTPAKNSVIFFTRKIEG